MPKRSSHFFSWLVATDTQVLEESQRLEALGQPCEQCKACQSKVKPPAELLHGGLSGRTNPTEASEFSEGFQGKERVISMED